MAIIYSYPSVTPVVADILLITQASDRATKSVTLSSVKTLFGLNDSLSGVGTPGYIPFFETDSRLIDSFINQDGNGSIFNKDVTVLGNTTLQDKLEVQSSIYATPIAYSSNQDAYALKMGANGNTAFDMGIKIKSNSGGTPYMSLRSHNTEDLLILEGGNVGIGTTSPDAKLDVNGGIISTKSNIITLTNLNDLRGVGSYAGYDLTNSPNGTGWIMVDVVSNGSDILSQSAYDVYASQKTYTRYSSNAGTTWSSWVKLIDSNDITVINGNVGIGTSGINPADKLHVMGTVRSVVDTGSGFSFLTNRGTENSASGIRWDNNNSSLTLKDSTNVITTKISSSGFSWFNGGSVGFGTATPAAPVEMVVNDASGKGLLLSNVGDNSAYDSVRVTYSGYDTGSPECIFRPKTQPGTGVVNTYFRFKTNGSAASGNIANVTVDGKVGIGTTNDVIASQLTVGKGDIEITKFATGLILRSNNGLRYRITVANDGTLTTTAV